MNFGFTEEQEILRTEVCKFLAERCPMEEARRIMETKEGFSPELWRETAELGWQGLLIPEQYGGAGLSWIDLVVLLEESGRALFPSPLVSSTWSVLALLECGSDAQQARWLPDIASGTSIFTLGLLERADLLDPGQTTLTGRADGGDGWVLDGEKLFVTDAGIASHFIVSFRSGAGTNGLSLAVVEAGTAGVSIHPGDCIDPSKRIGRVALDGVRIAEGAVLPGRAGRAQGEAAVARLLDHAAAMVTAEAIGAAEGAHALMVQYASERLQFGSPIGRYQGVKHPLAEMYVDIESFKSLLYYAAWCLDEEPEEAPRHVSMAKAYACDCFARIGIDAVELHGAIGYTWEYDAQLYPQALQVGQAPMYGSSEPLRSRRDCGRSVMDFKLTPEEESFRDELRSFLDEKLPPESERDDMFLLALEPSIVREKRWVGFSWPEEVGGGGG